MEPIEKVSSVEQAERQIREYILSDEVQIGDVVMKVNRR